MIVLISRQYRGINARYSEGGQTNGIKDIHHFFICRNVAAFQYLLVQAYNNEQYQDRNECCEDIDGIHKQAGRDISQYDIPHHSAAHRSGDAQDHHAKQIQLLLNGNHGA